MGFLPRSISRAQLLHFWVVLIFLTRLVPFAFSLPQFPFNIFSPLDINALLGRKPTPTTNPLLPPNQPTIALPQTGPYSPYGAYSLSPQDLQTTQGQPFPPSLYSAVPQANAPQGYPAGIYQGQPYGVPGVNLQSSYAPYLGQSQSQNVIPTGGSGPITVGGYKPLMLPMDACDMADNIKHKYGFPNFNEHVSLTRVLAYGLNLGAAQDNCKVVVSTFQQYIGNYTSNNYDFVANNPFGSHKLLETAMSNLFPDGGWKYNMFHFSLRCSRGSYCFRTLIYDDRDVVGLKNWIGKLKAIAETFVKNPGSNLVALKEPDGSQQTLPVKYQDAKAAYERDESNVTNMLRFINVLLFIDISANGNRIEVPQL